MPNNHVNPFEDIDAFDAVEGNQKAFQYSFRQYIYLGLSCLEAEESLKTFVDAEIMVRFEQMGRNLELGPTFVSYISKCRRTASDAPLRELVRVFSVNQLFA